MKTQYEKVVEELNGLIQLNYDRQKGYLEASEAIPEGSLRPLLEHLSNESGQFAEDLEEAVKKLLGTPASGQTFSGKMHQTWLNLKSAVTGKDREAILKSCEFGDQTLIEAYEAALKDEKIQTSLELTQMLEGQLSVVRQGRNLIESVLRAEETAKM
jgi:uncharacterized protein (TIGR02284 family)